jgi:hypothetical protein
MASSKIQELKNTLSMGARGNKYKIMLAAPVGPTDDFLIDTVGKAGAIPAKTIGQIEVWTQGRKLVIAGDATFDNAWALTFYNTQDHALRNAFDKWLLYIDSVEDHGRGAVTHTNYMTESAKIIQLNTTDNSDMATYEFRNMWPTGISAIEMADDQQDTVTEFTVDFAYSHWIRLDA